MSFFWHGKEVNTLQLTRNEVLRIVHAGRGHELVAAMAEDRTAQLKTLELEQNLPLSRRSNEKP